MDWLTGLCFFNILCVVCSFSDYYYSVNLDNQTFDDALESCKSDTSFLTNILNFEEMFNILKAVESKRNKDHSYFWIGLKKSKKDCVQDGVPLKGFHWTWNHSTESVLNKWEEQPALTCTSALCGLISVEYNGSQLIEWGLAAKVCNKPFPFICKHKNLIGETLCPQPQITGSHDILQKKNDPYNLEIKCNSGKTFSLTCSRSTSKWKLADGTEKDIAELCLDCSEGFKKDKEGNCVDVNECEQSNPCVYECFNTVGSYSCMCVDDIGNYYDEHSEHCRKSFDKKQDKPTSSPFIKKPVPSFQPANDNSSQTRVDMESTGDRLGILVPLIIALLILVVLIVITACIVKCCLILKKKRAKKREAVLKEAVALNGSDSMGKV